MAEIKLVRVDYRLIHGQVVARWLKVCPVRRIVLVDDVLGSDEFMSDIYKMAVPKGTDVDIVTIDKAKDKIDNDTGGTDCCNGISTKRFADDHRVSKCIKKLKKISENNRNCKF